MIRLQITDVGLIKEEEVIDASVIRISYAYPILEIGYEQKIQKLMAFLKNFDNLKISGRNGNFMYTHLHDMMKFRKEIIAEYISHIPLPLTERHVFCKLGIENGGQSVKPRSERC